MSGGAARGPTKIDRVDGSQCAICVKRNSSGMPRGLSSIELFLSHEKTSLAILLSASMVSCAPAGTTRSGRSAGAPPPITPSRRNCPERPPTRFLPMCRALDPKYCRRAALRDGQPILPVRRYRVISPDFARDCDAKRRRALARVQRDLVRRTCLKVFDAYGPSAPRVAWVDWKQNVVASDDLPHGRYSRAVRVKNLGLDTSI